MDRCIERNFVEHMVISLTSMVCTLSILLYGIIPQAMALEYSDEDLKAIIEALYNHRSTSIITGDISILEDDFDISCKQG